MLDIMEMRGFSVMADKGGRQHILLTPNGTGYAVQIFPDLSLVKCVFAAFETINPIFP